MNKLKDKKVLIAIMGVVLVVCLIVAKVELHAKHNLEEYNKYCLENCELTKVSDDELASIEDIRYSKAIDNIEIDMQSIEFNQNKLKSDKLNKDEQADLDAIKLDKEYSKDATYSIEEIVAMETNYDKVKKATYEVEREYFQRTNQGKIAKCIKDINDTKKEITSYDLTADEQTKLNGLNKEVKNSDYVASKKYGVGELEDEIKQYEKWDREYSRLLLDVTSRVSFENDVASAEAYNEANINGYSSSNDNANNSSSNSSSTNNTSNNSSNSNTKKTSVNANSSSSNNNDACYDAQGRYNSACATYEYNGDTSIPERTCPYKSQAEANAYGNAHHDEYGGYGVYPCAQGTWEIDWFDQ